MATKRVVTVETQIREQNERIMDVIGTKFEALNEKLEKQKLKANENLCKAFDDKMSLVNKLDEEIDKFQETLWKRITDFETTASETLSLSHFAGFKEIFEQSVADVKDQVAETKKKLENDDNEVDSGDDNEVDSDDVMRLVGMKTRIEISETRLEQILKYNSRLSDYALVFESIRLPLNTVVVNDGFKCCLWIVNSYREDDSESKGDSKSKDDSSSDCNDSDDKKVDDSDDKKVDDSDDKKGIKYSNGVDQLIVYFTKSAAFRFELTCKVDTNYLNANIEVLDQKKPGTWRAHNIYVQKISNGSFDVSGGFPLLCSDFFHDGNIYIRSKLH